MIKTFRAFGSKREVLSVAGNRYFVTLYRGKLHALLSDPERWLLNLEWHDFENWGDLLEYDLSFVVSPKFFLGFVEKLLASRSKPVTIEYDDKNLVSPHDVNDIVGVRSVRRSGKSVYRFTAPCGDSTTHLTREDWKAIRDFLISKGVTA